MTEIRAFVNGEAVSVPSGATALDCVRQWRGDEAAGVTAGRRTITDSRGLPIAPESAAEAGAIYRTVRRRADAAPRP